MVSPPWDIFLSPNFGQGDRVGGMLSEGSVAVATRCGRLQATRDAAESLWRQSKRDQGGVRCGGYGRYP